MFANHVSDKGSIAKTYEEPLQLDSKIQSNQKIGKEPKQTFSQRPTDGQQLQEKMLNVTHHQGNANENYNEIPPHTS